MRLPIRLVLCLIVFSAWSCHSANSDGVNSASSSKKSAGLAQGDGYWLGRELASLCKGNIVCGVEYEVEVQGSEGHLKALLKSQDWKVGQAIDVAQVDKKTFKTSIRPGAKRVEKLLADDCLWEMFTDLMSPTKGIQFKFSVRRFLGKQTIHGVVPDYEIEMALVPGMPGGREYTYFVLRSGKILLVDDTGADA